MSAAHAPRCGSPTPSCDRRSEQALGWTFRDRAHLEAALAHRSYCAEHPDAVSNERLEFLGDAVLGLVVTDHVYATYPDLPEGELAKLRASVVNAEVLAELAVEVDARARARCSGKGEDASGGRDEAVDPRRRDGGGDRGRVPRRRVGGRARTSCCACSASASRRARPARAATTTRPACRSYAAREFEQLPRYQVRAEGPDHSKRFFATVTIAGRRVRATARGGRRSRPSRPRRTARRGDRRSTRRTRRQLEPSRSRSCDDDASSSCGRGRAPRLERGRRRRGEGGRGRRHARSAVTTAAGVRRRALDGRTVAARAGVGKFLVVRLDGGLDGRDVVISPRDVGSAAGRGVVRTRPRLAAHPRRLDARRRAARCGSSTRGRSAQMFVHAVSTDRRRSARAARAPRSRRARRRSTTPRRSRPGLAGRRVAVKLRLMDQTARRRARQHLHRRDPVPRRGRAGPRRRARSTEDECAALVRARCHEALPRRSRRAGSSLADAQYVDLFGGPGGYQDHHTVYARAGEPCPRCRSRSRDRRMGGRSASSARPASVTR